MGGGSESRSEQVRGRKARSSCYLVRLPISILVSTGRGLWPTDRRRRQKWIPPLSVCWVRVTVARLTLALIPAG